MVFARRGGRFALYLCIAGLIFLGQVAYSQSPTSVKTISIKRIGSPPSIDDFVDMKPSSKIEQTLTRIDGFVQREPKDGMPTTEKTEVFMGYDDKNLYAVFLGWDSDPGRVRQHLTRRENLADEDT